MVFTNSLLTKYVRISPNYSVRTQNICRFTPHCMAGNLSVETCGNVFANKEKGASSNYGIGSDGRIALYCEEQNRSWCTSSKDNDQKAITVEVANNGGAPNWPISAAAWDSLVNLAVDVCIRYGKKKMLWLGSKEKALAYKPADDEMVVTCHRWFAAKACPGDVIYSRLAELANTVTSKLNAAYAVTTPSQDEVEEVPQAPVVTEEKKIWDFLKSKGFTDYATAGIMGNLFAESGLIPKNLQNAYEKKLSHTDDTYTAAVDNGSYKNFVRDGAGYGLAQWTYWSRKEGLYNLAKSKGKSISDLDIQLEYLYTELSKSFKSMVTQLNKTTSVKAASDIVLTQFEKPANQSSSVKTARSNYSTHFYNMYATKYKIPYTVRVTASSLKIRKGPGTNYGQDGSIKDRGIYTIVEEATGKGANMWGLLKSGQAGRNKWISLDYTEKT